MAARRAPAVLTALATALVFACAVVPPSAAAAAADPVSAVASPAPAPSDDAPAPDAAPTPDAPEAGTDPAVGSAPVEGEEGVAPDAAASPVHPEEGADPSGSPADPSRSTADATEPAGPAEPDPNGPRDPDPQGEALAAALLSADPAVHAVVPGDGDGWIAFATAASLAPETRDLAERTGVVVTDIGAPLATQSADDLVGGAGFAVDFGGGALSACSLGFTAWTPDGRDAVITAGHCSGGAAGLETVLTRPSADLAATYEPWRALGVIGFSRFGAPGDPAGRTGALDSVDIAAIDIAPDAGLTPRPAVTDWTTAPADDPAASATTITRVGQAHDGLEVAKSGRTTGVTTGAVQGGLGWARVGQSVVHGFMTTLPAADGDSGAAVYAGDTALGVVSGGNASVTWVADLGNALAQTGGYTLRLDLAEPRITGPADLGAVPAGTTLTGTAGGATAVRMEIAAAGPEPGATPPEPVEVPVAGDGTWSATAPSEPGVYTLRLTSRDGYNLSDAVEVRIVVAAVAETVSTGGCVEGVDCLVVTGAATTGPLAAAGAFFALALPLLWAARRSRSAP